MVTIPQSGIPSVRPATNNDLPMIDVHSLHRDRLAGRVVRCAVLTCSDTRTTDTDVSGRIMIDRLEAAGHTVEHYRIVRERDGSVAEALDEAAARVEVVLLNGGTGIGPRARRPRGARAARPPPAVPAYSTLCTVSDWR